MAEAPRISLRLSRESVVRLQHAFTPDDSGLAALGFYLLQQVQDRFQTQGASGGSPWPAKRMRSWGYDDGRSILTGHSARLKESFQYYSERHDRGARIIIYSDAPYAHVHQLGTTGRGGTLPTIRPKNAKALFIPITDRAITSARYEGAQAASIRRMHRKPESTNPYRMATRGRKLSGVRLEGVGQVYTALRRGRLHDGKLQRWNERKQEWEDGIPDFIFLQKVDIPPRPMLPTSAPEQAAQREMVAEIFARKEVSVG